VTGINGADIRKIVVACDAGMGSSVMLASQLRRELQSSSICVEHHSVDSIPADVDVVVCHSALAQRTRECSPGVVVVPFHIFFGDPAVAALVSAVKNRQQLYGSPRP
jgi:mannitol-specific phosphotransferase system IIBC component